MEHANATVIGVTSPLVYLPHKNLLSFYRRCMEINSGMINTSLGINEDGVVSVGHARFTEGLDLSEITAMVSTTIANSKDVIDEFIDYFGARPWPEEWHYQTKGNLEMEEKPIFTNPQKKEMVN